MHLITLDTLYYLLGIIVAFVAIRVAVDKTHPTRVGSAIFWGIFAITFLFGKQIPPLYVGYLVLIMVIVASIGKVTKSKEEEPDPVEREGHAERLKNKIFIPAILIPLLTIVGTLTLGKIKFGSVQLVNPENVTLIALGLATIIAFVAAQRITRAKAVVPVNEGSRLLQAVGWAVILPQMLAALGGIFSKAGVGDVVSGIVGDLLPTNYAFVAVAAYCIGMLLFTMIMGNAFAAFAVITGGIGLPLIVQLHGGNPAIMAALGMFAGYCGTLMTPMAANFNIVPTMLLNLKDKNAVIKAQVPIAIPVFIVNMLLMYFLVYHF
ncbi:DUF979 domain-containing protein [Niallia taxi]|uniref:DUF979 domain-containing protein n=1 Tax=Niallia taxi TaxID=2499688 RepID=A0A437K3H8_9BACI|nr:DUF979 domain-containing protein [Niallia taxi]MDK8643403.1 DUF979 domain-containing protein [Niallia taxi]MED4056391.1 DUF979 domain-containing protein [Niallia taxi]MED4120447.1 DUF979 domain-containing protein [Niallia taxi]RVT56680.1 DUF979 domain-containing protein [Niallia taxi]